jgi:hypothetical protein
MKKLLLLPLFFFGLGCGDHPLAEPVGEPEMDPVVTADGVMRTQYDVQLMADFECDLCAPWDERLTPSMMYHTGGGTNGFFVTGDLVGYALISGGTNAANVNFRTGKGVGSGTLHVDLTSPAEGAFDCHWHASWEGYMPPDWIFVEYGKWFNCKGSGAFEGKRMVLWNDNAANPGWSYNVGIAEIW